MSRSNGCHWYARICCTTICMSHGQNSGKFFVREEWEIVRWTCLKVVGLNYISFFLVSWFHESYHSLTLPGLNTICETWPYIIMDHVPAAHKASGKLVRDNAKISEYWQHTVAYGWHKASHPGNSSAAPVGLYGDDCKYNQAGAKLVCLNFNTLLQEFKRFLSQCWCRFFDNMFVAYL